MDMLVELQENEIKAAENNKIIKDGSYIYLLKKMKSEFEKFKEEFIAKDSKIKDIRDNFKVISSKTKELKEKIEADEKMIYSTNNSSKTVEKLQKRLSDNKKILNEIDDKNIILLESEEKLVEEKEILREKLVEFKNNFYEYKEASNKKILNAQEELKKYNSAIEEIKKLIPENILKEYYGVKSTKGIAVASIKAGVCSGCKMKVSAMTLDQIKKSKEKVLCDNCGRILYYKTTEE
jgi:predicted  nucleic acid-binding Zn-ribbon protein